MGDGVCQQSAAWASERGSEIIEHCKPRHGRPGMRRAASEGHSVVASGNWVSGNYCWNLGRHGVAMLDNLRSCPYLRMRKLKMLCPRDIRPKGPIIIIACRHRSMPSCSCSSQRMAPATTDRRPEEPETGARCEGHQGKPKAAAKACSCCCCTCTTAPPERIHRARSRRLGRSQEAHPVNRPSSAQLLFRLDRGPWSVDRKGTTFQQIASV